MAPLERSWGELPEDWNSADSAALVNELVTFGFLAVVVIILLLAVIAFRGR